MSDETGGGPAGPQADQAGPEAAALRQSEYTVVLTSCGRFDLLAETIRSLLAHVDIPPAAFIVVEDTGDAAVQDALAPIEAEFGLRFTLLLNRPQLGQMKAIDRAYEAVETPLIFHCEDDWEFFRSGFIDESRAILAAMPDVSMVGLRPRQELNPLVRDLPAERLGPDGPVFFPLDPTLHPEYFSYSFNPGLRRTAEALALMPFAAIGREEDVSYAFKKRGFRIANLEDPAVRHLGDGRHVNDPTSRPKPKTLLQRLRRSAGKRLKRIQRRLSGE